MTTRCSRPPRSKPLHLEGHEEHEEILGKIFRKDLSDKSLSERSSPRSLHVLHVLQGDPNTNARFDAVPPSSGVDVPAVSHRVCAAEPVSAQVCRLRGGRGRSGAHLHELPGVCWRRHYDVDVGLPRQIDRGGLALLVGWRAVSMKWTSASVKCCRMQAADAGLFNRLMVWAATPERGKPGVSASVGFINRRRTPRVLGDPHFDVSALPDDHGVVTVADGACTARCAVHEQAVASATSRPSARACGPERAPTCVGRHRRCASPPGPGRSLAMPLARRPARTASLCTGREHGQRRRVLRPAARWHREHRTHRVQRRISRCIKLCIVK